MTRDQFDRIVRSVAAITNEPDVLVVGSQAILGSFREADDEIITRSMDLDVSRLDGSDRYIHDIAGALGLMSDFEQSNGGAYADSVAASEIVTLPDGWRERLVRVTGENLKTSRGIQSVAWCLHPTDLVVSKYVAGRSKDIEYCERLIALDVPQLELNDIVSGLESVLKRHPEKEQQIRIALASATRAFSSRKIRPNHPGR